MLDLVIENQPHRSGPNLGGKLVRRFARHGSIFSGVGASGKPDRHDTHREPSGAMPPPGTIMWTWGWWVSVEPQVCRTDVMPMRAPRCLGSPAIVSMVSAEALNKRS